MPRRICGAEGAGAAKEMDVLDRATEAARAVPPRSRLRRERFGFMNGIVAVLAGGRPVGKSAHAGN